MLNSRGEGMWWSCTMNYVALAVWLKGEGQKGYHGDHEQDLIH